MNQFSSGIYFWSPLPASSLFFVEVLDFVAAIKASMRSSAERQRINSDATAKAESSPQSKKKCIIFLFSPSLWMTLGSNAGVLKKGCRF